MHCPRMSADDPLAVTPVPENPTALRPASQGEIAETLAYALRFDERGRPRPGAGDFMAAIAADWLVKHMLRSGFVVMKGTTAPPHTAG